MSDLLTETEEFYHSQSGEYLSSHLLGAFAWSPLVYHAMATGRYKRPDSEAYSLGHAVHCSILEGSEAFSERYTSDSPINPSTGKPYGIISKKYCEWAGVMRGMGLQPVNSEDITLIEAMDASVMQHTEAIWLLHSAPHREMVIRDKYLDMPCQIRMDALGEEVGIVDLKTCADLDKFPYDAKRYHYYSQLAFYRQVLRVAVLTGFVSDVHIIAVEKKYPYRCGVWHVDKGSLDVAQEENEINMVELKECQEIQEWPTRYEEKRELVLVDYKGK